MTPNIRKYFSRKLFSVQVLSKRGLLEFTAMPPLSEMVTATPNEAIVENAPRKHFGTFAAVGFNFRLGSSCPTTSSNSSIVFPIGFLCLLLVFLFFFFAKVFH